MTPVGSTGPGRTPVNGHQGRLRGTQYQEVPGAPAGEDEENEGREGRYPKETRSDRPKGAVPMIRLDSAVHQV